MNDFITVREIRQSEKGSLFSVYTDEGFVFSLSAKGLFETGVGEGKQFTADEFEEIRVYAAEEKVFRRAVWLLGRRDYGSDELIRKLGDEGENGEKAVARLVELGYINDDAYADTIIAKYISDYGKRRVEEELKKRFLPRDVWQEKLEAAAEDSAGTVYGQLLVKARGKDLSDRRERQKIIAYFLRRGFLSDDIREALRRYGQEDEDL